MTFVARKIEYFIAVAQEGSLTAAANKKFVTVPPVCKLISELEEEVGRKLFFRKGKGMQLTRDGKLLYDEIITHYNALNDTFSRLNSRHTIQFDIYGPFPTFLEDICHQNFKPETGTLIEVNRRKDTDDEDGVSNADFIYRTSPLSHPNNYEVLKARENSIILYSNKIDNLDIQNLPFIQNPHLCDTEIYKELHKKLVSIGFSDKVIGIDNEELRKDIVTRGDGISLITQSFIRIINPNLLKAKEINILSGSFSHYIYIKKTGTINASAIKDLLLSISYLSWS